MNIIGILDSNGRAGRFLVHEALIRGYQVRVLVHNRKDLVYFTHYLHKNVEIYEGGANDKILLSQFLNGCNLVINSLECAENKESFYEKNMIQILEVMNELHIKNYIGICTSNLRTANNQKSFLHNISSKIAYRTYPHVMKDKENALMLLKKSNLNWNLYKLPKVKDSFLEKKVYFHKDEIKGFLVCSRALSKFIIGNVEGKIYYNNDIFVWS